MGLTEFLIVIVILLGIIVFVLVVGIILEKMVKINKQENKRRK